MMLRGRRYVNEDCWLMNSRIASLTPTPLPEGEGHVADVVGSSDGMTAT